MQQTLQESDQVSGQILTAFFAGQLTPSALPSLRNTLQGINISHLGKRKIIFKMPFSGDMLVPWRVDVLQKAAQLFKMQPDETLRGFDPLPSRR